jgi:hypothetical protein
MKWARPENWEGIYAATPTPLANYGFGTNTILGGSADSDFRAPVAADPVANYTTGKDGWFQNIKPGFPEDFFCEDFAGFSPHTYDLQEMDATGAAGSSFYSLIYFDWLVNSDSVTNAQFGTLNYPGTSWKWRDASGNGYCPFINKDGTKMFAAGDTVKGELMVLHWYQEDAEFTTTAQEGINCEVGSPFSGGNHLKGNFRISNYNATDGYLDDANIDVADLVAVPGDNGPRISLASTDAYTLTTDALTATAGATAADHEHRLGSARNPVGAGPLADPIRGIWGTLGHLITKPDVTGMRLCWAGFGSWRLENHLNEYPTTANGTLISPESFPSYRAGYTDKGLKAYIQATDSNIFHIFLGANNNSLADNCAAFSQTADVDDLVDLYTGIVERYRRVAMDAGVNNPKFIIVGTYENTTNTTIYANREVVSRRLQSFAEQSSDVVYLDLQAYFEATLSGWASQGSTNPIVAASYLADSIHPAQAGMDEMMKFVWSRVVDSAGNY